MRYSGRLSLHRGVWRGIVRRFASTAPPKIAAHYFEGVRSRQRGVERQHNADLRPIESQYRDLVERDRFYRLSAGWPHGVYTQWVNRHLRRGYESGGPRIWTSTDC